MEDAQLITIQGEQITEDEIAGFHVDPVTRGFWITLSSYAHAHNGHKSLDYRVNPEDPSYAETAALYDSMFRVTADEEYDDEVYFRARHSRALESLYNYLEGHNYAFTMLLGATRHNYIRVFRKQHSVSGSRTWMKWLIKEYTTPKPEDK